MTIKDTVNEILRKPAFGDDFYQTPSNEMLLKKVPFGHQNKLKFTTFGEDVQKQKKWVPSPSQYIGPLQWGEDAKSKKSGMAKSPRTTVTDEIFVKGKKKEKSSPSPD